MYNDVGSFESHCSMCADTVIIMKHKLGSVHSMISFKSV